VALSRIARPGEARACWLESQQILNRLGSPRALIPSDHLNGTESDTLSLL